jgi:Flp pilus assembly protein TadG/cytoskeletal protein CcmA (bactofilin family)
MIKNLARRRGNVVILSVTLLAIMMGMVAFAVDLGYIAHARTELQRSADAVALAAAAKLPNQATATAYGINTSANNQSSICPQLATQAFEYGHWSRKTATFTTPTPAYRNTNAVRVTIRRTTATGNPLNLFFGRILGKQNTDITISSIAFNDRGLCGPFIGIQWADIGGNMTTDSYDSDDGTYSAGTASARGSVRSDGNIDVHGNATVKGDVRAGEGSTVTVSGNPVITGNIGNRVKPLDLPAVNAAPYADPNNNNGSIPNNVWRYDAEGKKYKTRPLDNQGDLTLNSGETLDLAPGIYYFRNVTINGGASLNITGETVIYVTGDLKSNGGAFVNNNTQKAEMLEIRMTGATADITSTVPFYGVIYAPNTDVKVNGSCEVYGAIVGKTLKVTGDALGHYDESLEMEMADPPTRTTLVY